MNAKKQANFVRVMGKGKRQKFSKGGLIRRIGNRHYFDDGGAVGGPTALPSNYNPSAGGVAGATGAFTNPNATINNPWLNPGEAITNPILNTIGNSLNDNFQATSAPIQQGTNSSQLNSAYTGAQGALQNQGNVVGQLTPQIPGAVTDQNALAAQELQMTQGVGPNPAQTMLNQATGANVANQAALMAGQRGASGNVGLIARQNAQQGAATQQNAAGQAATLEAQTALGAQQNLTNLANQQVNQGAQAVSNQNTAQQGEQGILQNANTSANNAQVGMQSNINSTNAQTAAANQNMAGQIFGSLTGGGSSLLSSLDEGGVVGQDGTVNEGKITPGTDTATSTPISSTSTLPAAQSSSGSSGGGGGAGGIASLAALFAKGGNVCHGPHNSHVANFLFAGGGKVPAMVSPGEIYLSPEKVRQVIHEGMDPAKVGKKFTGKAKVKGDSVKNDIIPTDLEEGGIVIDRKNMGSREKRELFVHKAMARKKARMS